MSIGEISSALETENGNPNEGDFSANNKLKDLAERIVWFVLGLFNFLIDLFTQPLADFLGLETLRHGTSWRNYINIRMSGPDPTFGGGKTGATFGHQAAKTGEAENQEVYIAHSKGKFFAYLGSNAGCSTPYIDAKGEANHVNFSWYHYIYYQAHVRVAPHTYGFGAGAAISPKSTGKAITAWRFLMAF